MNSFAIAFVVTVLVYQSSGYTITGDEDGDYHYDNVAMEMDDSEGDKDCFISATLEGCSKGDVIKMIYFQGEKETTAEVPIEENEQKRACLPATCTTDDGKRELSTGVDIGGGTDIKAKPDEFKEGSKIENLFDDKETCMSSSEKAIVTVKCVKQEKELKIMAYEQQEPNGFDGNLDDDKSMQQDDNDGDDGDDGDDDDGDRSNNEYRSTSKLESSYAQEKVLVNEEMTAKVQWNNWFRGYMLALCGNRQAIYRIRSRHSNCYEDRVFEFGCKHVSCYNFNHCYWTGYVNHYDQPLLAHCGANYVMTGLQSIYSHHHRDRRFSLKCCRAPHYYNRHCYLSGYVNGWDGYMNYVLGGQRVFTGLYSWHDNGKEDRVFKVGSCRFSR